MLFRQDAHWVSLTSYLTQEALSSEDIENNGNSSLPLHGSVIQKGFSFHERVGPVCRASFHLAFLLITLNRL
jgi:hypothetical protein